ncbi:MAG: hypothetical protein MR933_00185 [Prevotella sp.]|uniref:OstA-like protein n=1 Tax=Prevotella sp. TaxID=59823 RepID=UPI0025EB3690|nr:OstA-like protein [Prevotella sp.]MCI7118211.1 hypothetical protein [Prevotella sp.]
MKKQNPINLNWHRTVTLTVLCLFVFCLFSAVAAPYKQKKRKKTDERVYLVHADQLSYDVYSAVPDAQILRGKVHFTHAGSQLTCDSAYFYQESNSVEAFGHVHFRQGDTLSLTCNYADYNGADQMMHARHNVVLKHRTQTLYTDSLDYDRIYNLAYFFEGGKLVDGKDRLVSDWGAYSTATRQASFYYGVEMYSGKNHITTDTLHYDTRTSVAHVVGPSTITSKGSIIHTSDAYLNSHTDQSQLFGRSTIVDKDKSITGDSLYHNSKTGLNEGFGNVVYIDKENKNELRAQHVFYNEQTGYGYATNRALMLDYSQKDTLWMHADSLKIYTHNIGTDSVYRKVHAFPHVRAYRQDLQAVCDSLVFNSQDSCMTMYRDPIAWNYNRQLLGEVMKVYMNDSTVRKAEIIGQALSVEKVDDKNHYNQVSSTRMNAYFNDGAMRRADAIGSVKTVFYNTDNKDSVLTELNYLETDTMRMYMSPTRQLEKIWASKSVGTMYPITQIPPDKYRLPEFAWFDYVRPTDKDDVFNWRGKKAGSELKAVRRREAPIRSFE